MSVSNLIVLFITSQHTDANGVTSVEPRHRFPTGSGPPELNISAEIALTFHDGDHQSKCCLMF